MVKGNIINVLCIYLLSLDKFKHTYVGYTKNLSGRLKSIIVAKVQNILKDDLENYLSKKFTSKSEALKSEYKLKNNFLLRKKIKNKAL